MVSKTDLKKDKREEDIKPVVLSEGASVALGNVFNRINKSRTRQPTSKSIGKRPRTNGVPIVLTANERVREELQQKKQDKKRYKEARKAKLQFENNNRVIPDAATNATMEKEFLMTATRGAVALFNAVAKAQKATEESSNKSKKSGTPISRNSFMNMMRAGVKKDDGPPGHKKDGDASDSDDDGEAIQSKAKWLRDDFLTARSKTLRDWDREVPEGYGGDQADDEQESESSGS